MSLDIFQDDATAAQADASQRIAPDLPAGFTESLETNWRAMTDFNSSVAYQASRSEALGVFGDDVYSRTGVRLPTTAYGEGLISPDEFNSSIQKLNDQYPVNIAPLTEDDVDRMTLDRMRKAKQAADALGQREKTWGGTLGSFLGTTGGAMADPIAAMTLPLGGAGELGVLGRAIEFGAISGGTTAATAAAGGAERERAVPGSSAEIPGEIASSTAFGAVLGGAFGAFGKWLKAGEKPLPTSMRDEVNVGTSEAQLNATNVFPTAEGEIAGRDAMTQAVGQAAKGEPISAGNGFDPAHVQAFADAAGAHDPAALAEAGERALRPITFDEVPDVEHLATMPVAGEDTAGYWDRYLEGASPEERAALGATDESALTEHPPAAGLTSEAPIAPVAAARDIGPTATANLAADPQTYDAIQKALIDYRVANPDAEYSVQVRQPDGSYQLTTRKLADVMDDIDQQDHLASELMTCAVGATAP